MTLCPTYTYLTSTGTGSNAGLPGERPMPNCLSRGMALKTDLCLNCTGWARRHRTPSIVPAITKHKFPDYSSHGCTLLDTVATQLLYIVVCVMVCKLKFILSVCVCGVCMRARVCMLDPVPQSQSEIFSSNVSIFMYTVLIDSPDTVVRLKSSSMLCFLQSCTFFFILLDSRFLSEKRTHHVNLSSLSSAISMSIFVLL